MQHQPSSLSLFLVIIVNEATKIAVGVMGGLVFVALVLVGILLYIRYRRRKLIAHTTQDRQPEFCMMPPEYTPASDNNANYTTCRNQDDGSIPSSQQSQDEETSFVNNRDSGSIGNRETENGHLTATDREHVRSREHGSATNGDRGHMRSRGNGHDMMSDSGVRSRENGHAMTRDNDHVRSRENGHMLETLSPNSLTNENHVDILNENRFFNQSTVEDSTVVYV